MVLDYLYYITVMGDIHNHDEREDDEIQNYDHELYFILLSMAMYVLIQNK